MTQWGYQYPQSGQNAPKDEMDFTALLEDASVDELQELIENEDKINEIVLDHEKVLKNLCRNVMHWNLENLPFYYRLKS